MTALSYTVYHLKILYKFLQASDIRGLIPLTIRRSNLMLVIGIWHDTKTTGATSHSNGHMGLYYETIYISISLKVFQGTDFTWNCVR